jgi:hydrogenase maturation factor
MSLTILSKIIEIDASIAVINIMGLKKQLKLSCQYPNFKKGAKQYD